MESPLPTTSRTAYVDHCMQTREDSKIPKKIIEKKQKREIPVKTQKQLSIALKLMISVKKCIHIH